MKFVGNSLFGFGVLFLVIKYFFFCWNDKTVVRILQFIVGGWICMTEEGLSIYARRGVVDSRKQAMEEKILG